MKDWAAVTEPFEQMPSSSVSSTSSLCTVGAPNRSDEVEVIQVNNAIGPLLRQLKAAQDALQLSEQEKQKVIGDYKWVNAQLSGAKTEIANMKEQMRQGMPFSSIYADRL